MTKPTMIRILKILVPIASLLLGGLYIWITQVSQNKPKFLPSSKLRTLSSAEDQYWLETEAEPKEPLLLPSSKSLRMVMPSSKSGFLNPTIVLDLDENQKASTEPTEDTGAPITDQPPTTNATPESQLP